jgi:hypothetical protein
MAGERLQNALKRYRERCFVRPVHFNRHASLYLLCGFVDHGQGMINVLDYYYAAASTDSRATPNSSSAASPLGSASAEGMVRTGRPNRRWASKR